MTPRRESCLQERQGVPRCVSLCPSIQETSESDERSCGGVMDVISAFLFGRVRRPIFIEVPTADPRSQLHAVLTTLVGSLCGPRDAPLIWQDRLRCADQIVGIQRITSCPMQVLSGDKRCRDGCTR